MAGMLYLCATPIGNLEDITLRVLRILQEADVIAAEDTRQTRKLLTHYEIRTPLTSYHEHNKMEKTPVLIKRMLEGETIALVTDAGTPAISDPGEDLARACYEAGIQVTSLPGPAAVITAIRKAAEAPTVVTEAAVIPQKVAVPATATAPAMEMSENQWFLSQMPKQMYIMYTATWRSRIRICV